MTAVEQVRAALDSLAVDHSGLSLQLEESNVGYPGGSYLNRNVVVSGDGKVERYNANLIERGQAWITAGEIVRQFGIVAKQCES